MPAPCPGSNNKILVGLMPIPKSLTERGMLNETEIGKVHCKALQDLAYGGWHTMHELAPQEDMSVDLNIRFLSFSALANPTSSCLK